MCLDIGSLFEVHNGRIGDVADVDTHDEVDEGVPNEKTLVHFTMGGFENILLLIEPTFSRGTLCLRRRESCLNAHGDSIAKVVAQRFAPKSRRVDHTAL